MSKPESSPSLSLSSVLQSATKVEAIPEPSSQDVSAVELLAQAQKAAQEPPPAVRERIPLDIRQSVLSVPRTIPGYHLAWFNDNESRLERVTAAGYEFVSPEEVGMTSRDDSQVRRLVSRSGPPLYAYLMKIREEWYREDRAMREQAVDEIDTQIHANRFVPVEYGYTPKGHENTYTP